MTPRGWLWAAIGAATTVAASIILPTPVFEPPFTKLDLRPHQLNRDLRLQERASELTFSPSPQEDEDSSSTARILERVSSRLLSIPDTERLRALVARAQLGLLNVRWSFSPLSADPALNALLTQRSNTAWLQLCNDLHRWGGPYAFLPRDQDPSAVRFIIHASVDDSDRYVAHQLADDGLFPSPSKPRTVTGYHVTWEVWAEIGPKREFVGKIEQTAHQTFDATNLDTPEDITAKQLLQLGDGPEVLIEQWLHIPRKPKATP